MLVDSLVSVAMPKLADVFYSSVQFKILDFLMESPRGARYSRDDISGATDVAWTSCSRAIRMLTSYKMLNEERREGMGSTYALEWGSRLVRDLYDVKNPGQKQSQG